MPGSVIRHHREFKSLSQKYVAEKIGISQNAYSKLENNLTQLTVHHVKQLANIFNVPILQLVKDEFEIHKPSHSSGNTKLHIVKKLDSLAESIRKKKEGNTETYMAITTILKVLEEITNQLP